MQHASPLKFVADCLEAGVFDCDAENKPIRDGKNFKFANRSETFMKLDQIHRCHNIILTLQHVQVNECVCGDRPEWIRAEQRLVCSCGRMGDPIPRDYGREIYRKMEAARQYSNMIKEEEC